MHNFLSENNFIQNDVDNCVYVKQIDDKMIVIVIWVDDLIIRASNDLLLCETKNMFKERFKMKDLGNFHISWVLILNKVMVLSRSTKRCTYVKLLRDLECLTTSPGLLLRVDNNGVEPVDSKIYREAVGCLIYDMICTRLDICWIVTKLSQYLSKPLKEHWVAVKYVLR